MSKIVILLFIAAQLALLVSLFAAAIYLEERRGERGASITPMNSPLVAVVRSDGQIRMCVAKAAEDGSQDVECSPWR